MRSWRAIGVLAHGVLVTIGCTDSGSKRDSDGSDSVGKIGAGGNEGQGTSTSQGGDNSGGSTEAASGGNAGAADSSGGTGGTIAQGGYAIHLIEPIPEHQLLHEQLAPP